MTEDTDIEHLSGCVWKDCVQPAPTERDICTVRTVDGIQVRVHGAATMSARAAAAIDTLIRAATTEPADPCRVCGCNAAAGCIPGCAPVPDPANRGPLCSVCRDVAADVLGILPTANYGDVDERLDLAAHAKRLAAERDAATIEAARRIAELKAELLSARRSAFDEHEKTRAQLRAAEARIAELEAERADIDPPEGCE